MKKPTSKTKSAVESQQADSFQFYCQQRYSAHVENRRNLDDLAFKTSERYDHWILTLAGGALALSLTYVEKIAPNPKPSSWAYLEVSWFFLVAAIVVGFLAIYFSREAIYDQIKIFDEGYNHFQKTATESNPAGTPKCDRKNCYTSLLVCLNLASLSCFGIGLLAMCFFGLVNLGNVKLENVEQATNNCNLISTTNSDAMSKKNDKGKETNVPTTTPDGSIKGVHVGDPTGRVNLSYRPPEPVSPPPPPSPNKPSEK